MPVSFTATRICPSPVITDVTVSSPPTSCIASIPLSMRLSSTCWSWTKSALTMGNSGSNST